MSNKQTEIYEEQKMEYLMDQQSDELSECCGAGTYGDYKICEECKEHC